MGITLQERIDAAAAAVHRHPYNDSREWATNVIGFIADALALARQQMGGDLDVVIRKARDILELRDVEDAAHPPISTEGDSEVDEDGGVPGPGPDESDEPEDEESEALAHAALSKGSIAAGLPPPIRAALERMAGAKLEERIDPLHSKSDALNKVVDRAASEGTIMAGGDYEF